MERGHEVRITAGISTDGSRQKSMRIFKYDEEYSTKRRTGKSPN